jgi:hypothetical protein
LLLLLLMLMLWVMLMLWETRREEERERGMIPRLPTGAPTSSPVRVRAFAL